MKTLTKALMVTVLTLVLTVMLVPLMSVEGLETNGSWGDTVTQVEPTYVDGKAVYEITTPEELAWIAQQVNTGDSFTSMTVKLMDDINLAGKEWVPIAKESYYFSGTFDGGNHTINNITMNNTDSNVNNFALFGVADLSATIKNFSINGAVTSNGDYTAGVIAYNLGTIENVHSSVAVSGITRVGGITGQNSGEITNSSNMGAISGTSFSVGGLVGSMDGKITNSYNTADVTTTEYFGGGIVGFIVNPSTIKNVYNSGNVSGNSNVGSIVGAEHSNNPSDITNAYYLTGTAADPIGYTGHAYTISPFDTSYNLTETNQPLSIELNINVDAEKAANIDSTWKYWDFNEQNAPTFSELTINPSFWSNFTRAVVPIEDSSGTIYEITTPEELAWIAQQVNAGTTFVGEFVQLNNSIDLAGKEWTPIGTEANPFKGTFLGNKQEINNLTINNTDPTANNFALFGYQYGGTIKDFSISGNVSSVGDYTAGVVAQNYGETNNVHSSVNVSGDNNVGGITSYNVGYIYNANNTGSITATGDNVGGLAGSVVPLGEATGFIVNSYNTGSVTSKGSNVGGIAGRASDDFTINNTYNGGAIAGLDLVGSIIGLDEGSRANIEHTYYLEGTAEQSIGSNPNTDYPISAFDENGFTSDNLHFSTALNAYKSNVDIPQNNLYLYPWTGTPDGLAVLPSMPIPMKIQISFSEMVALNLTMELLEAGTDNVMYRTFYTYSGLGIIPYIFDMESGTYDLRITKIDPNGTKHFMTHVITGIELGVITHHAKTLYTLLELPGNNGVIGTDDIMVIASEDNYNKSKGNAANPNADLNGDGEVNFADIAFARNSKNFGTNGTFIQTFAELK